MKKYLLITLIVLAGLSASLVPHKTMAGLFAQSGYLVAASTQYFEAAMASTIEPSGNMTYEGWYYFDAYDVANEVALVQAGDDSSCTGKDWQAYYCSSAVCGVANRVYVDICASSGTTEKTGNFAWTPTANTWYHIAIVYDTGGNVALYINGTQQGSTDTGYPTTLNQRATASFKIGGYTASGVKQITWDANVQLARMWSTNLSGATISANKCSVYASGTSNLGGQWSLDNVLTDSSGNSNTLTAINSATFTSSTTAPCSAVSVPGANYYTGSSWLF